MSSNGRTQPYGTADYPLAEKHAAQIRSARGKPLEEITLAAVLAGEVSLDDLRITRQALQNQAEIALSANRPTLAQNFERAAELVEVPQEFLLQVYEFLRPGRASKAELLDAAATLRERYGAERIAAYLEEAAEVYEKRRLFRRQP